MAEPRVFVSSTYYDLRHVRDDIEQFLRSLGYTPVMHDKGNVTYPQGSTSLEQACYNELSTCDIVICIIGGAFGTQSSESDYSITMEELQTAIRKRKKIFIYILKAVYAENFTYIRNKDSNSFQPYHVNDIRIHEFIFSIKQTLKNSPIQPFETVSDITSNLRQQFAGMFQHLLAKEAAATETKTYYDLQDATSQIKNLIDSLSEEQTEFFQKFNSCILATSFPLRHLLKRLDIEKFKVFAPNKEAIIEFLNQIGYRKKPSDLPFGEPLIFQKEDNKDIYQIELADELFEANGEIKDIRKAETLDGYIKYTILSKDIEYEKDDLPF